MSGPKCWRDWGPLFCHIQTTVTKILLRVPHCARLGKATMSGAEADVHINTRPSSVNAKDAHRIIPTPVHLTAPPQVEPQLHFSQDSASLLTSSWNLAALWLGWSGLPATSQLSQTLDPRPTLPVTGSSPRDCPEQYFCFVLFLPGLTRQHRGKVVMFYFGISLICSRWLKEFLFFKI